MSGFKDTRAQHTARQTRLHKKDRRKGFNQQASACIKPWKFSKGYGTYSGQIATPGRNYGRHIDNALHENVLHMNKPNNAYHHPLDDEDIDMDLHYEWKLCEEAEYNYDGPKEHHAEVDLMSIARPARVRKNKKHSRTDSAHVSPALMRVEKPFAIDALDLRSITTGSEFDFDFGWSDGSARWSAESSDDEEDVGIYNHSHVFHDTRPSLEQLLANSAYLALEPLPIANSVYPILEPLLADFHLHADYDTFWAQLEPLLIEFGHAHEEIRDMLRRASSPVPSASSFEDVESLGWDDVAFSESEIGSASDAYEHDWVDLCDEVHKPDESKDMPTYAQMIKLEAT